MTVGIRADWCIALRMIALQEFYRLHAEMIDDIFAKIISREDYVLTLALGEPNEHS